MKNCHPDLLKLAQSSHADDQVLRDPLDVSKLAQSSHADDQVLKDQLDVSSESKIAFQFDFGQLNRTFKLPLQIEKLWSKLGDRPAEAVELAFEQLRLCQRLHFHAGEVVWLDGSGDSRPQEDLK